MTGSIEFREVLEISRAATTAPAPRASIEEVVAGIARDLRVEDPLGVTDLLARREVGGFGDHRLTLLARLAALVSDRSDLVTLPGLANRIQFLPYQVNAALRVLTQMGSRALLADEVGLGKTIEAGIVLKELAARGLAKRILILTPASLVEQWMEEMRSKFDEEFTSHEDAKFRGFAAHDRIIASIDTAKMEKHMPDAIAQDWDLVVVDEAHYLKNRNTQRYRFLESLFTRYLLFLTATPMQNSLKELFNLVHLVRPGLLGSENHFSQAFLGDAAGRELRNGEELQRLLAETMIRNRRQDTGIQFTDRIVRTERLAPSDKELALHRQVEDLIRHHYKGSSVLPLLTLQREVASSPPALAATLRTMREAGTIEDVAALEGLLAGAESTRAIAKARFVVDLASKVEDKFIVYTQFRRTQDLLARHLAKAGHSVQLFHGGLSPARKSKALKEFRDRKKVLLCTDSGSEGLNLQFANLVVNYDLPWNPMRVEQRIGRVHRIGQARDVLVVNLSLKDTIEDYVLQVLYEKIRLFEVAIGEMDLIISSLPSPDTLEKQILDVIARSKDSKGVKRGLGRIAQDLEQGRHTAEAIRRFDEEVFSHFRLGTTTEPARPEGAAGPERGRFLKEFVASFARAVGAEVEPRGALLELRFPRSLVKRFRKRRLVAFDPDAVPPGEPGKEVEVVTPQADLFRRMQALAQERAPVGFGARRAEPGVAFHYLVELAGTSYEWSGLETVTLGLQGAPLAEPVSLAALAAPSDGGVPAPDLAEFGPVLADPPAWVRLANERLLERIAPRLDELARSVEAHLRRAEKRLARYFEQVRNEQRAEEVKVRRRIGDLSSRIWFTEDGLREIRMEKERERLQRELNELKLGNNRLIERVDREERERLAREYARAVPRVTLRLVAVTLIPSEAPRIAAAAPALAPARPMAEGVRVEG